jgi:maleylacetoacetate isomerase
MADSGAHAIKLYHYWRSSSAYRVRIAMNLKGLSYELIPVHLVRGGGEQHRPEYREVNPLGLVPALQHESSTIVQSLAICEYLEECYPQVPLLPPGAAQRARVRALVQTVCSEVQPLNNLAVLQYLKDVLGADGEGVAAWYGHWIERGFTALESWLNQPASGDFCHGDQPTLADCFLVPQVYNAERFNCDLQPYPRIREITARCRSVGAFATAAPENQPDAES